MVATRHITREKEVEKLENLDHITSKSETSCEIHKFM